MIERDNLTSDAGPKMRETPADPVRMRAILDALIRAKGVDRYALFLTTREGIELPGDLEEASGYLVAPDGRHFFFWMGADSNTGLPALVEWRAVEPRSHWQG